MLKAGVSAYLLKDSAWEELASAIRTVLSGTPYLSPKITDVVLKDYLSTLSAKVETSAFTLLTPREREVLQLIAEGLTTREIAAALFVSVKTVETHRQQLMDKLDLRSVAELTKYAIREWAHLSRPLRDTGLNPPRSASRSPGSGIFTLPFRFLSP